MKCSPVRVKANVSDVSVSAQAYAGESGCMQVELQYLWSGQLGEAHPSTGEAEFKTRYAAAGSKEINLVVVSASGVIDRCLDIIDVE